MQYGERLYSEASVIYFCLFSFVYLLFLMETNFQLNLVEAKTENADSHWWFKMKERLCVQTCSYKKALLVPPRSGNSS